MRYGALCFDMIRADAEMMLGGIERQPEREHTLRC